MYNENKPYSTAEHFVLDKGFVRWVLSPDRESQRHWETFRMENPHLEREIEDAILIIRALQPAEENVPINRLDDIYKQIRLGQKSKEKGIRLLFRYAAAILILLAATTTIWHSVKVNDPFPVEMQGDISNKGKIILGNGEIREFETEKTIITQTTTGVITINNDTLLRSDFIRDDKVHMNQIIIPYGKRSEITLADGTHIWLNSGSQLSYPSTFTKDSRDVYLTGEAFFEVAHNPDKPFYVHAKDFKIRVLGTRFNVSSYTEELTIQAVLVDGKINASGSGFLNKSINLSPGERVTYRKTDRSLNTDKVDVNLYTSWINGYLIFKNEPTLEVFRKLERYYNRKIIARKSLDNLSFSGKLDLKNDIKDVLDNISFASSVKISEENDSFIIE